MHSFEEHCQKSAFQGQFEHKPLSAEGYSQQSPPLILYLFGLQLFCALVIDVAAWTNPHVIGLFFFFPEETRAATGWHLYSAFVSMPLCDAFWQRFKKWVAPALCPSQENSGIC